MFGRKKEKKVQLPEKCPEGRTTCCKKCLDCAYKKLEDEGIYLVIKCQLSTDSFIVAPFRDVK